MIRFNWGVCGMQELLMACWDGHLFTGTAEICLGV